MKFINLDRQYVGQMEELNFAATRVLASGRYILGPEVEAFEREFAKYCGVKHCIGVACGTDALVLSLLATGVGEGDKVIVPANTYIATWFAVSRVGATPIPVEPRLDYCIDVERIEEKINNRTKAIIPVHLFGHPAEMQSIFKLAEKHYLAVISDCAQAHGARYDGKNVGAFRHLNAFSFYPTKTLGGFGDGGAVMTDDDFYADQVRMSRWEGQTKKGVCFRIGYNSLLDELQAALLRVKLADMNEKYASRLKIADRYYDGLYDLSLELPYVKPRVDHVFHQFVIRHPERDKLRKHLAERDVPTMVHYPIPPHLQGAYRHLGYEKGDFPITEEYAETMISLPICPTMTEEEVDLVVNSIRSFFE